MQAHAENLCFYLYSLSWAKPSRKSFWYQQKHSQKKSLVGRRIIYHTLIDSGKFAHDFAINLFWAANLLIPSIIMNWPKRKRIPLPPKIARKEKQFLSILRQKMSLENCNKKLKRMLTNIWRMPKKKRHTTFGNWQ